MKQKHANITTIYLTNCLMLVMHLVLKCYFGFEVKPK